MYKIWFEQEKEMKSALKLLFFCGYKWIDDSTDFDYPKESRCIFINNNIQEISLDYGISTYEQFLKVVDYTEVSIDVSISFNPVPEKILIEGKYYSKEEILKTIKPL